jgi:hypothetical protein
VSAFEANIRLGKARNLVLMALVCVVGLVLAPPARADVNENLCHYTPVRDLVPNNYALDACVDGEYIVIKNEGNFPVVLVARRKPDGHTTSPIEFDHKAQQSYAAATRLYHNDKLPGTLVLPGDQVRFADGDDGASIEATINTDDFNFYLIMELLSSNAPIVGAGDEVATLVQEIEDHQAQFAVCKTRGFLAGSACGAKYWGKDIWSITKALTAILPTGRVAAALRAIEGARGHLLASTAENALHGKATTLVQGPAPQGYYYGRVITPGGPGEVSVEEAEVEVVKVKDHWAAEFYLKWLPMTCTSGLPATAAFFKELKPIAIEHGVFKFKGEEPLFSNIGGSTTLSVTGTFTSAKTVVVESKVSTSGSSSLFGGFTCSGEQNLTARQKVGGSGGS